METAKQKNRTALNGGAQEKTRRPLSTQVRTRCKLTRSKEQEVKYQLHREMPQIVKAHIEKAKSGSLVHTKWLWGVADSAPDEGAKKTSLAELLLRELAGSTNK